MAVLQCALCTYSTKSLKAFTNHYQVHRNVANFSFPCGVPECSRHFRKYAAFRSHVYRDHKFHRSSRCIKNVTFLCQVPYCSYECTSVTEFLAHLKNHILQKLTISCPFKNCDKSFSVKSSFTAHISRCHRDRTSTSLSGAVLQSVEHHREATQEQCTVNDELTSGVVDDSDTEPELMSGARIFTDTEQFMHSIALFLLKIAGKIFIACINNTKYCGGNGNDSQCRLVSWVNETVRKAVKSWC